MNHFDEVIDSLGSFGPYQIRVFILVSAFEFLPAWAMLLPVFIGRTPEWWCVIDANQSYPGNETAMLHQSCGGNKSESCLAISFDDSFTSIVSEFGLICDKSGITDHITTLQMIGLVVGAAISGQLADLIGRKKILFSTYLCLIVTSLLSAVSNSWILYAAIRLLVGASVGGLLVVNFILPIEYVGKRWRTVCGCVGFWAAGIMSLPLWAYFIRSWRMLCIATACGGAPILALWWFIPESCRWLATRGRYEEAEKIITDMARVNNKPVPDFTLLRSFALSHAEIKDQRRRYSYWHLCLSPKSALWTFICMYAWFASSSVYYGVSYNIKNLSGDIYLNVFLSGLVEFPALIFVLIFNNRLGRRWTVFTLFLITGISLLSIILIDYFSPKSIKAILAMALIGKSTIAGGWAAVQIFSAEKFPTLVRNLGIAFCALGARIGGVIAPQIVTVANLFEDGSFYKQLPFVIFGCIGLICAVLVLLMSETANLPLPDKLLHSSNNINEPEIVALEPSSDSMTSALAPLDLNEQNYAMSSS